MADQPLTTTRPPLIGKVAQILNSRELVINIGSIAGVSQGMVFAVTENTPDITDPDTGQVLGSVAREKVRLRAVQVQDRLTVCRTYETYTTGGAFFPPGLSWLRPTETHVRTLRQTEGTLFASYASLDPSESFVRIGDLVKEVQDESTEMRPPTAEKPKS